ncbi:hypothetical protein [Aeromonas salmonicida]|uniref:hypothetical protein n=1 Tax=Aeromonas salmonicida TaxID=645 RepID=UPI00223EF252|nr:hypothetical protein [Aeromonas salmonicida]
MGEVKLRFAHLVSTKLFWMTVIYLVCELAFSADLLALCSREATIEEIDALEDIGRLLTGTAISLLFIGLFIDKQSIHPLLRAVYSLILIAGFTWLNHQVQDAFIDHRIASEFHSAEARKGAFLLTMAGRSLSNGTLNIRSIHTPDVLEHKPSLMAFVAIFPSLAFNYPNVQSEMNSLLKKAIAINVMKPCEDMKHRDGCMGSPAQFNNEIWPEVIKEVERRYADYTNGFNETVKRTSPSSLQSTADNAWVRYVKKLRGKGVTPDRVPPRRFGMVRIEVRKMGVPVPDDWHPADRQTFNAIVRQKTYSNTWKALGNKVGTSNPTKYMSIQAFMLTAKVQQSVQKKLGAPKGRQIPLVTRFDDIKRLVYLPIANQAISKLHAEVDSAATRFVGDGPLVEKADSAVKTLVVVPLALLMSLLGGFGHMIKITTLLLRCLLRKESSARTFKAVLGAIVFVGGGIFFLYQVANPLVETKAYQTFSLATAIYSGNTFAMGLEFIIRLQEFAYPINAIILTYKNVIVPTLCFLALFCFCYFNDNRLLMMRSDAKTRAIEKKRARVARQQRRTDGGSDLPMTQR